MGELRIYELRELWQKYCMSDEQLPYLLVSYQAYADLKAENERLREALERECYCTTEAPSKCDVCETLEKIKDMQNV